MATEIYLGRPPENIVNWIKAEAERKYQEMLKTPLTFTAEEAGSTIKMVKSGSAPTVYLETSYTGEEGSWSDFIVCTKDENGNSNNDGTIITLTNVGDKVYFRAKQDNWQFANVTFEANQFVMTGKIAASGNINTLLKADGSVLDLTGRNYCYDNMFNGCTSLTQAPELPATTLATNCYGYMFSNCTSLTQAPELPATTLADNCYYSMFGECTSLTSAPELPATTLADYCYAAMFYDCSSLTQAPELPVTTLADYCYQLMFYGCSLTQAPELPATTLADYCYSMMFYNCSSLTQAPELPATTLANYCYDSMFGGCVSLTQASFPNLEKETVTTEVVESQSTFVNAASDIETTCKDGILIINSTTV